MEQEAPKPDTARVTASEVQAIRSPFEPLVRAGSEARQAGAGPEGDSRLGEYESRDSYEMPDYHEVSPESVDISEFDLAGPEEGALGQLRNLYASAERMGADTSGAESADGELDELLDRQRTLISEYFRESGGFGAGLADANAGEALLSFASRQPGAQ